LEERPKTTFRTLPPSEELHFLGQRRLGEKMDVLNILQEVDFVRRTLSPTAYPLRGAERAWSVTPLISPPKAATQGCPAAPRSRKGGPPVTGCPFC